MRPKKLVMVLNPDPTELGIQMFSLSINGFRVVGAHTVEQANEIGKRLAIDAVLTRNEVKHECNVPVVVAGKMDTASVIVALKQALIVKRGPKTGFRKPKSELVFSAKTHNTVDASMK